MKKEVRICDECKNIIAIGKCDVCNMDLCASCGNMIGFIEKQAYTGVEFVVDNVNKLCTILNRCPQLRGESDENKSYCSS